MNSGLRLSRSIVCLALLLSVTTISAVSQSMKMAVGSGDDASATAAGRGPNADKGQSGVPRLIKYNGTLKDASGAPRVGTVGVVFALYGEPTGGAPLWQEVQNVQLDAQGRYNALLGSGRELPAAIFTANDARWLGVQVMADAEAEQPRTLLVSVAYALKAQDSETLGGLPASAYVLSDTVKGMLEAGLSQRLDGTKSQAAGRFLSTGAVSTAVAHTTNAIPKFTAPDTLGDSLMLELYNQPGFDAFGTFIGYSEDVVRLGDGTGLSKRLQIAGRLVAEGFDVTSSQPSSVHVVNTNSGGFALQVNALSQSTDFTNGIFATAQSSQAIGLAGWVFEPLVPTVSGSQYSYGVWGQNYNPTGAAVFAAHVYDGAGGAATPTPTGSIGIYASTAHTAGIPAVFDQRAGAGGKILSGRLNGTEVIEMTTAGHITAAGTISANAFDGNGALLTNVAADTAINATNAVNASNAANATNALTANALAADPTDCGVDQYANTIDASGNLTCAQPASTQLTDSLNLIRTGQALSQTIQPTANVTPLIVRGAAGSTSDLFDVRNALGGTMFRVDQFGQIATAGTVALSTGWSIRTAGNLQLSTTANNANSMLYANGTGSFQMRPPDNGTATAVANLNNTPLRFCGSFWDGGAAADDCWRIVNTLGAGANPTSTLNFLHAGTPNVSVGANFTGNVAAASFSGDGSALTGITATTATTANALAANPSDCVAGQYATTIAANGDLTCTQVAFAELSGTTTLAVTNADNNFSTSQTVTGTVTASAFSGPLTGNVTGNVAGNLTGNVTGNVSGNAGTATLAANSSLLNGLADTAFEQVANKNAASGYAGLNGSSQIAAAQAAANTAFTNADNGFSAKQTFAPATTSAASVNIDAGAAPTTPAQGDIWNEGGVLKVRIDGTTTKTVAYTDSSLSGGTFTGNVVGNLTGNVTGDLTGNVTGNVSGNVTGNLTGDVTGNVTGNLTGNVTGNVSGNAGTATALAANPSDCVAGQYATTIAANGDLTCAQVAFGELSGTTTLAVTNADNNFSTSQTVTGTVTASAFSGPLTGNVTGNVTGNLTGNVTGNVSGNAGTATALAANPSDCVAGQYATTIAANGDLTCTQVAFGELSGTTTLAVTNANNNFSTSQTVTGTVTASAFSGPLTGNVTGNVTGNLTGNVTGNVSGNAANVTGTVAMANGGTGLTVSGAAGSYLRSNGTTWASSAIQLSDLPSLAGSFVDLTSNQSIAGTKTLTGTIDASAATSTMPVKVGATFPATCVANKELFIKIGGFNPGQQVFLCDVSGTSWNQVGDGLGNNNNLSFNPVTIPINTVNLVKNTCTTAYTGVYPANVAGQDIPIPPASGSLSSSSTLVASVLSSTANSMPAAWDSYTFQAYVDSSGVRSFLHVCNFTLTTYTTSGAITFNVRAIN